MHLPRAPRPLCQDCDPPRAVALSSCAGCGKFLCGHCETWCTEGCEWHGAPLCESCFARHSCIPIPAEGTRATPAHSSDASGVRLQSVEEREEEKRATPGAGSSRRGVGGKRRQLEGFVKRRKSVFKDSCRDSQQGPASLKDVAEVYALCHVMVFALCLWVTCRVFAHMADGMFVAYLAALLCARRRGAVVHFEWCRGWTMLAVVTTTLVVTGSWCSAFLGLIGIICCPRWMLWWPRRASASSQDAGDVAAANAAAGDVAELFTVRTFVRELTKWRKKKEGTPWPSGKTRGVSASERALHRSWVEVRGAVRQNRVPEEGLAMLRDVGAPSLESEVQRLVAAVRAWQAKTGAQGLPTRGSGKTLGGEEDLLAKRWQYWQGRF